MTRANYLGIAFNAAWHVGPKPSAPTRAALQDWLLAGDRNGCFHDLDTARELQWVASDRDILVSVIRVTSGDEVADLMLATLPDDRESAREAVAHMLSRLASDALAGGDAGTLSADWVTACDVAGYRFDETSLEMVDELRCSIVPKHDVLVALICRTLPGAIAAARGGAA